MTGIQQAGLKQLHTADPAAEALTEVPEASCHWSGQSGRGGNMADSSGNRQDQFRYTDETPSSISEIIPGFFFFYKELEIL